MDDVVISVFTPPERPVWCSVEYDHRQMSREQAQERMHIFLAALARQRSQYARED